MRASFRFSSVGLFLVAAVACASEDAGPDGEGPGSGGTGSGTGGSLSSGGTGSGTGGSLSSGGQLSTGGGSTGGGAQATGGMWGNPSGGAQAAGGRSSGGQGTGTGGRFGGPGSGGASSGGASSGGESSGGASSGGAPSGTGGTIEIDCDATMPSGPGTTESATWAQGGSGNLVWEIWSNGGEASPGSITVFDDAHAFIASWNNSGNYLGRMGLEWGNSGRKYTEYGTIKADYVWNKSPPGSAGQYSYLGVYGWSTDPCVEWYIVEDSFHDMPFNTGDLPVDTTDIDDGVYNLVYRHTTGTGGDRCGGASSWDQFYSIRLEGKRCGTITVSDHFDAWAEQGWNLGNLLEVKIVVEAAAGEGYAEFPLARVTTSETP